MKFLWTTIHVKNMEEAIAFYQDVVGLKLMDRFNAGPGMEISFFGEGETKLEVICSEKFKGFNPGNGVSMGFKVESLDEAYNMVKEKGYEVIHEPFQPNPHVKYFIFLDPNGYKIQFAEQS
ncbi:VOC family protein [Sedimentibacter sp.]|uniref:VOC family protein n=1 Tax=Sedimentibacter sp. TaxID=1960295 RepID=UPI00289EDF23|nr:VOC family protein [Sedimentibacter sp.]